MSQGLRVLVVEDNPDARSFLEQILKAKGYRVDAASDGQEALSKATSQRYDLILSDIEMPRMDGVEATRALRALEASEHREPTPVIALTAQDNPEMRERASAAGMQTFLAKPVRSKELLSAVMAAIDDRCVVLVVDDAEQNRALIGAWLNARPRTRVLNAERAGAALACMRKERVDVVLLDMVMPGIDGYAAARLLRALPDGREVPIIAITAKVGDAERAACLAAGCTDYLPKPLERSAVLGLVDRYGRTQAVPAAALATSTAAPVVAAGAPAIELDEFAAALVPTFLANRRAELPLLMAALRIGDFEKLSMLGHNLRGSGGSYGFPQITDIGAAMESAGNAMDESAVGEAIAQLKAQLREIFRARGESWEG